MYIAMNRFKVMPETVLEFEEVWRSRDSNLGEVPGFVSFSLLRGAREDDHVLYASHTIWKNEEAFTAWTKSENFRKAHAGVGERKPMTLGHPNFEGFTAILDE